MRLTITRRRLLKKVGVHVVVVATLVLLLGPVWWVFLSSFRPSSELFQWPPTVPTSLTLEHYARLLETTRFASYFVNSFVVAVITILFTLSVTIPAAYSLSRYDFRGQRYLLNLPTLIYMFPYVFLAIPFFLIFANLNLVNTRPGLAVAHTATAIPIALLFLYVFFDNIPKEFEESARIAGASRMTSIRRIFVPMAVPGIAVTTIYIWVHSWIEFFFALVILESPEKLTLPLGIANLINIGTVSWGMILAGVMGMSLPSILVIFYLQKYLIKGFSLQY